MCSQIGRPAPTSAVCSGRDGPPVSSILSESMPTKAGCFDTRRSAASIVRKGLLVKYAGVPQCFEKSVLNRIAGPAAAPGRGRGDRGGRGVGEPLQGKVGEVDASAIAMPWSIDIGSGIA